MRTMLDGSMVLVAESAAAAAFDARCFGPILEGAAPDAHDAPSFRVSEGTCGS